ncbi:MAG: carbon monoxide dehydrogenase [Euryarchaeota archaeon]|nr:carbon monoxide dehydrogenase [Euryarchaeota archaeon]
MKIAISGKGGVGKTTVAAVLARLFGREGRDVLLVDADPAPNTASALGLPRERAEKITPLCEMADLIEERTGVRPGTSYGQMFRLNPRVEDIAEKFGVKGQDGVHLLVLGTIKSAGQGCFCPESALLKALVKHLVLRKEQVVILDMEAGLEHLGRGTAQGMDLLIMVVEPGLRSTGVARQISRMSRDLGITRVGVVINKVGDPAQAELVERELEGIAVLGTIPRDEGLVEADLGGLSPLDHPGAARSVEAIDELRKRIVKLLS